MTTEAITNNYDLLNSAQMSTETVSAVSPASSVQFDSVLNKKLEKPMTMGDVKEKLSIGEASDKMADFKEILANATSEANVESSLDLTLARDINEIIGQLKDSIDENKTVGINTADDNAKDVVVANPESEIIIPVNDSENEDLISSEETDSKETDFKEMLKDAAPEVFEQILALADKAAVFDKTGVASKVLDEVESFMTKNLQTDLVETEIPELSVETDVVKPESDIETSEVNLDEDMLRDLNIESVEAETDSSTGDSLMNRQSPQEHSVKVMLGHNPETFEISINKTSGTENVIKPTEISQSKIIEQITKQLEGMHNGSKVDIVLNPASLGKINLQIMNTQGGLSAQFTVSSNEVRDLLMKGLDNLKEILTAQGVSVDNISVKLNETEKSSYNPDWKDQEGSRGGNKDQGQPKQQEKEKGLFEKTIAKTFKENGNV